MKNIIQEHFNQSSLTINSLKKHEKKILKIVNLIVGNVINVISYTKLRME